MNLLKDENVFLDNVSAVLLHKATEALTGYKHNQLRKYDSKDKKHELNKKEHYQKLEQLLKSMLSKVREFKNSTRQHTSECKFNALFFRARN